VQHFKQRSRKKESILIEAKKKRPARGRLYNFDRKFIWVMVLVLGRESLQ
jgi:hypothetical protein